MKSSETNSEFVKLSEVVWAVASDFCRGSPAFGEQNWERAALHQGVEDNLHQVRVSVAEEDGRGRRWIDGENEEDQMNGMGCSVLV